MKNSILVNLILSNLLLDTLMLVASTDPAGPTGSTYLSLYLIRNIFYCPTCT